MAKTDKVEKKVTKESDAKIEYRARIEEIKKLYPAEYEVKNAPGGEFETILKTL